jgi:hypothetical protein
MVNDEVLIGWLVSLGSTPEEVAATILGDGITGYRGHSISCPVANWLAWKARRELPEAEEHEITVSVGATFASVYRASSRTKIAHALMPEPVTAFVVRFDHGEFTNLLRV